MQIVEKITLYKYFFNNATYIFIYFKFLSKQRVLFLQAVGGFDIVHEVDWKKQKHYQ